MGAKNHAVLMPDGEFYLPDMLSSSDIVYDQLTKTWH